jgi:hypothetical protein
MNKLLLFFYENDLLAIKWRNYKVHMLARETSRGDVRASGPINVAYAKSIAQCPSIKPGADAP